MGDIDGHANFVHALDHLYAKMTQATVVALKSTRAETVPVVVDQLTNALAKKIEPIDIVDTAEVIGILDSNYEADLVWLSYTLEIFDIVNSINCLGALSSVGVHTSNKGKRLVPPRYVYRRMKYIDAH